MYKIPRSIAVIMDGNGRWAQSRGLERVEGHVAGVEALRRTLRVAAKRGVKYITFYAFSTENWGRPTDEVTALMELMGRCFVAETPSLLEQGVRIVVIGDKSALSESLQQQIAESEQATAHCESITMQLALNYSSRDEIVRSVRDISRRVAAGELSAQEITEQTISEALDTITEADPDLVIRTSGEQRLSNFLMWQASYSEFYFTPTLWPDFGEEEFDLALKAYSERDRRFGLVVEE